MNPDCREGKHRACNGDGWDTTTDAPADCLCDCHHPDTLAGALHAIEQTAHDLGAADVVAGVDQLRAQLADERNRIITGVTQ